MMRSSYNIFKDMINKNREEKPWATTPTYWKRRIHELRTGARTLRTRALECEKEADWLEELHGLKRQEDER